jgi:hypothetical protein
MPYKKKIKSKKVTDKVSTFKRFTGAKRRKITDFRAFHRSPSFSSTLRSDKKMNLSKRNTFSKNNRIKKKYSKSSSKKRAKLTVLAETLSKPKMNLSERSVDKLALCEYKEDDSSHVGKAGAQSKYILFGMQPRQIMKGGGSPLKLIDVKEEILKYTGQYFSPIFDNPEYYTGKPFVTEGEKLSAFMKRTLGINGMNCVSRASILFSRIMAFIYDTNKGTKHLCYMYTSLADEQYKINYISRVFDGDTPALIGVKEYIAQQIRESTKYKSELTAMLAEIEKNTESDVEYMLSIYDDEDFKKATSDLLFKIGYEVIYYHNRTKKLDEILKDEYTLTKKTLTIIDEKGLKTRIRTIKETSKSAVKLIISNEFIDNIFDFYLQRESLFDIEIEYYNTEEALYTQYVFHCKDNFKNNFQAIPENKPMYRYEADPESKQKTKDMLYSPINTYTQYEIDDTMKKKIEMMDLKDIDNPGVTIWYNDFQKKKVNIEKSNDTLEKKKTKLENAFNFFLNKFFKNPLMFYRINIENNDPYSFDKTMTNTAKIKFFDDLRNYRNADRAQGVLNYDDKLNLFYLCYIVKLTVLDFPANSNASP